MDTYAYTYIQTQSAHSCIQSIILRSRMRPMEMRLMGMRLIEMRLIEMRFIWECDSWECDSDSCLHILRKLRPRALEDFEHDVVLKRGYKVKHLVVHKQLLARVQRLLCVCMYVCMYVCVYVCMYVFMRVCVLYAFVCACIYVHVHVHICICICMCTCTCMFICMYVCIYSCSRLVYCPQRYLHAANLDTCVQTFTCGKLDTCIYMYIFTRQG
jgi:hypothetical protein